VHPDEVEAITLEFEDLLQHPGSTGSASFRARSKQGEWRWLECSVVDLRAEPTVHGVVITYRDITDRKHAEENRSLLASIVESSMDPIVANSQDGSITAWNRAAEHLFGYSTDAILGRHITCLSHPSRLHEAQAILESVRCGKPVEPFETLAQNRQGEPVEVTVSVFPIKDDAGQVLGAAASVHDITLRKQTQRRLDDQIARLSALVEIGHTIGGTVDLPSIAQQLLKHLLDTLHVDAAALLLLDRNQHALDYFAGAGFRSRKIRRSHVCLGEGLAGQAALTRTPFLFRTLAESPIAFTRHDLMAAEQFVGYAAIPLVAKGQVTGVLEVYHRTPLAMSADEWEFMEALAGQAALAIDNARLFGDLQRLNADLVLAYDATIEGWARALDLRDHETEGHSRRVTARTVELAQALNVRPEEIAHIRRGALLHDIGKMGIPDSILAKPGPLSAEEWEVMRRHPVYAYEMLAPIAFLRPALEIPYCHHEKWDGSGYPRGLRGEQIPLAARIFAVVDVWDALCFDRPYRRAWPMERVLDHIRALSGSHFDPDVVEAFLKLDPML
jgi:PAS domain S-box-containing protein